MEKTIDDLQAVGTFVFVRKDEPETEKGGILMPEPSLKKPNTGDILSVGQLVDDENISKGKKAIFNASAGQVIEIFDTAITVLPIHQVLGVL